ncbi:MAG: ABC transporter ATP-binding protein, partial [Clostridia bacterium]|nr:ABC transporter ATP-binding protein [Clostridia bacterium]
MKLKNVSFSYGKKIIYDGLSLSVPDKKITCVLGPSGCGKTTLLNMIGGVIPYSGIIEG